jgi:hypothetical protein
MDDVGRKKVQTLVCDEIAGRTFDDANANMKAIMEKVKTDATNYFASVGITLDFIGYADTWTFDDAVQAAINRRYVASQDKEIALALEPYTATIQALAAAQALRSFGDKSDGKLPTTIVGLPTNAQELQWTASRAGSSYGSGPRSHSLSFNQIRISAVPHAACAGGRNP